MTTAIVYVYFYVSLKFFVYFLGRLEKAKHEYKVAYKHSQRFYDQSIKRACALNLGAVYVALLEPGKGVKMLIKALSPDGSTDDDNSNADVYFNLGLAYEMQENYTESLKCFKLCLSEYKLNPSNSVNIRIITDVTVKCAMMYSSIGNVPEAAQFYDEAAQCYSTQDKFTEQAVCLMKLAPLLLQLKHGMETLEACDNAFSLLAKIPDENVKSMFNTNTL